MTTTTSVSAFSGPSLPSNQSPTTPAPREPLRACEVSALAERALLCTHARGTSFRAVLGATRETSSAAALSSARSCRLSAPARALPEREEIAADEPRMRRPRPLRAGCSDGSPTDALEAFRPPSPVLAALPPAASATERSAGSGVERAEAAALAERLVVAMRIGRVGRDGHVVQLRVRGAAGHDVDVRLRYEHGRLAIVLAADAGAAPSVERLERALAGELARLGIAVDTIAIERT
jgi:hypothetical protein